MTHFNIMFGMTKNGMFWTIGSPVLRQNQDIWNFHGSLTLNNKKLIAIVEALGMSLCQILLIFSFCLAREKNAIFDVWVSSVLMQNPNI